MSKIFFRIIFLFPLLGLFCIAAIGQETIRPLDVNPQILKYRENNPLKKLKSLKATDILSLPFRDDFSSTEVLPDPNLWMDENVYVNSNWADSLLSMGIATFDIVGPDGNVYTDASKVSFFADALTSKPINLKGDSIFLSFYFQAGGKGDMPDLKDTLMLEFYSPTAKKWTMVWYAPDSISLGYYKDLKFHLVLIPITDTSYLQKGFQFRFRNRATLSGDLNQGKITMNVDQWHIDYVYLDSSRKAKYTNDDISFYKPLASVLTTYTAMPFDQFKESYNTNGIKSQIEFNLRNNDASTRQANRNILITERNKQRSKLDIIGPYNIAPEHSVTYLIDFDKEFLIETKSTKKVIYDIKCYIEPKDKWRGNDTVRNSVVFDDYFAYDDGTSEFGYGFDLEGNFLAYGFNTFVKDTLTGVQIYFNPTYMESSNKANFQLVVWNDNNGKPGNKIFILANDSLKPKVQNEFVTFWFDTAIVVNGKFYVGLKNLTPYFLNIGYDLNTNNQNLLFYSESGRWVQSGSENSAIPKGSLMMRPIMRTKIADPPPVIESHNQIGVFPNPASDNIQLNNTSDQNAVTKILFYNSLGQIIHSIENPDSGSIDIRNIPSGLYFLKIFFHKGNPESIKLLKK